MKAVGTKITRSLSRTREPRWRLTTTVRADNGSVSRFTDEAPTYHLARLEEAHVLVQYAKTGYLIEKHPEEVGEP